MKYFFLFVTLAGCLAAAGAFVLVEWSEVDVSLHGYLAMALGVFFTILLGAGLMALVFYSNRAGHDVGFKTTDRDEEGS